MSKGSSTKKFHGGLWDAGGGSMSWKAAQGGSLGFQRQACLLWNDQWGSKQALLSVAGDRTHRVVLGM